MMEVDPSILKDSFAGYTICDRQSFFQCFENVIPLFLALLVTNEKSNVIKISLDLTSHFSLAAFKILSLYLTFDSLTMIHLHVDLFEFILLGMY